MNENPYQSPADALVLPPPIRLRRGRNILLVMAGIILFVLALDIGRLILEEGWRHFPSQFLREVVRLVWSVGIPLALITAIWRGRVWARYAFVACCVLILMMYSSYLQYIPRMIENHDFVNAGMILLMTFVYSACALFAFCSSAITGLIHYRIDERERDED